MIDPSDVMTRALVAMKNSDYAAALKISFGCMSMALKWTLPLLVSGILTACTIGPNWANSIRRRN